MSVDELSRLEEERDFLLASLRDLDRERAAGDISDTDYAALREDYTARTAVVLRAIRRRQDGVSSERKDGAGNGGSGRRAAPPLQRRSTPRWRAATVAGLLVFVAAAAMVLSNVAGPRGAGQPVTGTVGSEGSRRLEQALQLEQQGKATEALKLYDAVLSEDPQNVAALSYRGWLLQRAGLVEEALESLDRAIAIDPAFPDARFFRGMTLYQGRNDPAAAIPEFRRFLASDPPPDMVPLVEQVLQRALADAGQLPATTTTSPAP